MRRAGAVALAKALAENTGLKRFVISDNYIGTLGASTIAGALAQNKALESLALRNCELSDAGAERLCQALLVRYSSLVRDWRGTACACLACDLLAGLTPVCRGRRVPVPETSAALGRTFCHFVARTASSGAECVAWVAPH